MSASVNELMEDNALEAVPADQTQSWLQLTWHTAGIMIADFFIIRKRGTLNYQNESINISGIISTIVATTAAHYALNSIIKIEFSTSFGTSVLLYTILREFVFWTKNTIINR